MNKTISYAPVLFFSFFLNSPTFAEQKIQVERERFDFSLEYGPRTDSVNWTINAFPTSVNVLSELDWKNMQNNALRFSGSYVMNNTFTIGANLQMGGLSGGTVRDSDYCQANRGGEFSRSLSDVDADSFDAEAYVQMPFAKFNAWQLHGFLGYGKHQQDMTMTNGRQILQFASTQLNCDPGVVSQVPDPANNNPNFAEILRTQLNSKYNTEWTGPLLGVLSHVTIGSWFFDFRGSYSFAQDYEGNAFWNLRKNFLTGDLQTDQTGNVVVGNLRPADGLAYRHSASANGYELRISTGFLLTPNLILGLSASRIDMTSASGTEIIKGPIVVTDNGGAIIAGESCLAYNCVVPGAFNAAKWQSEYYAISIIYNGF